MKTLAAFFEALASYAAPPHAQALIHLSSALFYSAGALIAWHYLPPYLSANPGIRIIVIAFVVHEIAHCLHQLLRSRRS